MHAEALDWVSWYARVVGDPSSVLDIGGRDVNGSPRAFFATAVANGDYVTLDVLEGADITADAATWRPDRLYDAVVCTEVFEHAKEWRAILATAYAACAPGGHLIVTCAGPGRVTHSGVDGLEPRDWEWYGNVSAVELLDGLEAAGWTVVACEERGQDTRGYAIKEPQ